MDPKPRTGWSRMPTKAVQGCPPSLFKDARLEPGSYKRGAFFYTQASVGRVSRLGDSGEKYIKFRLVWNKKIKTSSQHLKRPAVWLELLFPEMHLGGALGPIALRIKSLRI